MPLYIMFSITSLMFAIPILTLYLYKRPVPSFRNRLYLFLLILNIIGLLSEIGAVYFSTIYDDNQFVSILFDKIIIAYFITWGIWLTIYLFNLFVSYIIINISRTSHKSPLVKRLSNFTIIRTISIIFIITSIFKRTINIRFIWRIFLSLFG